MKHSIVRAEKPVEDIEELTQADIYQDEDELDQSNVNKSKVTFNEENSLVADVGNEDTDPGAGLELEEAVPLVSARAVSTPASESSPRPSEALLERPGSAKSDGASSVADNNLGIEVSLFYFKVIKLKRVEKGHNSKSLNFKI